MYENDSTVCVDCGAFLGDPLSDAEADSANGRLSDRVEALSEHADDFFVPLYDKLLAVLCLLAAVAAIVSGVLAERTLAVIRADVPTGVTIIQSSGGTTVLSDGNSEYRYPAQKAATMRQVAAIAPCAVLLSVAAAIILLFPRVTWKLSTLRYRLFYNWDTTPTWIALFFRKAVAYLLAVGGLCATAYGWFHYL